MAPASGRVVVVAIVAALAAVGLLIAIYFTLVTYRVVAPDAAWVPRFCRMEEDTCFTVLDSDYARVFGVPNSVLGLFWYGGALVAGLAGVVRGAVPLCATFVLLGAITVAVSVYLAYALLFVLETHCKLCYTSHLLNVGLLLGFAWTCL